MRRCRPTMTSSLPCCFRSHFGVQTLTSNDSSPGCDCGPTMTLTCRKKQSTSSGRYVVEIINIEAGYPLHFCSHFVLASSLVPTELYRDVHYLLDCHEVDLESGIRS